MNTHEGYSKKKLDNTLVLLAGGGDKSLADFLGGIQIASSKIQYKTAESNAAWQDLITLVNTDENVKQTPKTDNVNRPLMMINGGTSAGELTSTSMFSTGIYANAKTQSLTVVGNIIAAKFHSNASAIDRDLTRIPGDTEIALETGNGNGGVSAWIWRENYASSNWGIFHNNSTDEIDFVGGNNIIVSIGLGGGSGRYLKYMGTQVSLEGHTHAWSDISGIIPNTKLPARLKEYGQDTTDHRNADTTCLENGFYWCNSGTLPTNVNDIDIITVNANNKYAHQLGFKFSGKGVSGTTYDGKDLYTRIYNNQTWSDWYVILTSGNWNKIVTPAALSVYTKEEADDRYLPLTAGSSKPLIGMLYIKLWPGIQIENTNNNNGETGLRVASSDEEGTMKIKGYFGWLSTRGTYLYNASSGKYLGILDNGIPHYHGNELWHKGNLTNLNQLTNGPGYLTEATLPYRLQKQANGTGHPTTPDDFMVSGFAWCSSGSPGGTNGNGDCNLISVFHNENGWGHQLAFKFNEKGSTNTTYDSKDLWTRMYNNTSKTWTDWYTILTSGNWMNFITSSTFIHNHDDLYVNVTGDSMTGDLTLASNTHLQVGNLTGASNRTNYISAGSGYSKNSGKYGVKVVCCDQSDAQSGLGLDLVLKSGWTNAYNFCLVGANSPTDYGYISFVSHLVNDTNYRWLGGFYDNAGVINFTVLGTIQGESIKKAGGTSSLFLKADGSVDSNGYVKKTGDTMSGALIFSGVTGGNYNEGVRILDAANKWAGITFGATGNSGITPLEGEVAWFAAKQPGGVFAITADTSSASHGLSLTKNGDIKWYNNILLHAGNYTNYVYSKTTSDGRYLRKDTNDSTAYTIDFTTTSYGIRCGGIYGRFGSNSQLIHLYERVNVGYPSGWGGQEAPTYGLSVYGGCSLATNTGSIGIATTSPELKLDVNGVLLIYIRGNNNSAFRDLLLLKLLNSTETSGDSWGATYPTFGIGFRRYWTSGNSPYGETTCAGIYATISSSWRGGLVFRTKNNQTQGGTHDVTALRLAPSGAASFATSVAVGTSLSTGTSASIGTSASVGTSLSVGTTITAGGTIKSTYSGPAFAAHVATGNWSYMSYKSGTKEWHIGLIDSTSSYIGQASAFEIRSVGASYSGISVRYNTSSYGKLVVSVPSGECSIGYYSNGAVRWTVGCSDGTNFGWYQGSSGGWKMTLNTSGDLTATNFYTTSDRNKKTNISSFSEHIRKFQLKDTEKWYYGIIAQEVEEMFRDGEEGNMTVNYNSVLSYYIGQLENRVKMLEDKLKKYEEIQNI